RHESRLGQVVRDDELPDRDRLPVIDPSVYRDSSRKIAWNSASGATVATRVRSGEAAQFRSQKSLPSGPHCGSGAPSRHLNPTTEFRTSGVAYGWPSTVTA